MKIKIVIVVILCMLGADAWSQVAESSPQVLRTKKPEISLEENVIFEFKTGFFENEWSGKVTIPKGTLAYQRTADGGDYYVKKGFFDFAAGRTHPDVGLFVPSNPELPITPWAKPREKVFFGAHSVEINDDVVRNFKNRFQVVSLKGASIANAKVSLKEGECFTDEKGFCDLVVKASVREPVKVTVSKEGVFTGSHVIQNNFRDRDSITARYLEVDLVNDYLCEKFRASEQQSSYQTAYFVSSVITRSKIQKTAISPEGICLSDFKQKRYLSISLDYNFIFNEINMTNYSIASKLFDDVIRKLLNELTEYKSNGDIHGFDIQIKTSKVNFVDKTKDASNLLYRFYIPRQSVQVYKDKDITGQQLIDQSIILLNDDRIDLRLQ
jgi:hypothetical protein